jgi:hypothetical protein
MMVNMPLGLISIKEAVVEEEARDLVLITPKTKVKDKVKAKGKAKS